LTACLGTSKGLATEAKKSVEEFWQVIVGLQAVGLPFSAGFGWPRELEKVMTVFAYPANFLQDLHAEYFFPLRTAAVLAIIYYTPSVWACGRYCL